MSKYDFSAFDNANEESLPEQTTEETDNKPVDTEALLTGVGKGASFGFKDELAGLLGAGFEGARGNVKSVDDLLNEYRSYRDIVRKQEKQAEERSPGTVLTGEIAGGLLVPTPISEAKIISKLPKLAKLATEGIALGAATGAGMSEADLTKGDVGKLATDVASGATVGGGGALALPAAGAAARGIGSLAKEAGTAIPKIPLVKSGILAAKKGFEGVDVLGEEAYRKLGREAEDLAKSTVEEMSQIGKDLAAKQSEILKQSNGKIDLLDLYPSLKNAAENMNPLSTIEKRDVRELNRIADNILENYDLKRMSASDVNNLKNRLQALSGTREMGAESALKSEQGIASLREPKKIATDTLYNAEPKLKEINQKIRSFNEQMDALGIDAINESNMSLKDKTKAVDKINKIIQGAEKESGASLSAQSKLTRIADAINEISPGRGDELKKQLINKSEELDLASKTSGESFFGIPLRQASKYAGYYTGKAGKKSLDVMGNMFNKSPEELINIGNQMLQSADKGKQQLGKLFNEVGNKGPEARKAFVFSIMQNPEYRRILSENSSEE